MRLVRSLVYRTELKEIAKHVARDSPRAAIKLRAKIERQVEQLRDHPHSGRCGLVEGARELVICGTSYLVVYKVGREVTILRVIHCARRWPRR